MLTSPDHLDMTAAAAFAAKWIGGAA